MVKKILPYLKESIFASSRKVRNNVIYLKQLSDSDMSGNSAQYIKLKFKKYTK